MATEMTQLRIYVAGPYSDADPNSVHANVVRAIEVGIRLLKKGHWPFIPHLTHYVDLTAREIGVAISWAEYIEWDLKWLEVCDAVLFIGSSPGADIELERARQAGKHVFHSVADVPTAALEARQG